MGEFQASSPLARWALELVECAAYIAGAFTSTPPTTSGDGRFKFLRINHLHDSGTLLLIDYRRYVIGIISAPERFLLCSQPGLAGLVTFLCYSAVTKRLLGLPSHCAVSAMSAIRGSAPRVVWRKRAPLVGPTAIWTKSIAAGPWSLAVARSARCIHLTVVHTRPEWVWAKVRRAPKAPKDQRCRLSESS